MYVSFLSVRVLFAGSPARAPAMPPSQPQQQQPSKDKRRRSRSASRGAAPKPHDWLGSMATRFEGRREEEAVVSEHGPEYMWTLSAAQNTADLRRKPITGTEQMSAQAQRAAADLQHVRMTLSASTPLFEPNRFTMVIDGRPVQVRRFSIYLAWFRCNNV